MAFSKTWVDGEVLYAVDLNGNFDDVEDAIDKATFRRSTSTEDTTEYSASASTSWTDLGFTKTFTCPEGTNNLIHSIKAAFDVKAASASEYMSFRIKVTNNTNSEVAYLYKGVFANVFVPFLVNIASTSYSAHTIKTNVGESEYNADGTVVARNQNLLATSEGSTYTITFEARRKSGSALAYVKDITLAVDWVYVAADSNRWS